VKELPVRKSPRLKGYDYSEAGYYFITICTKNRYEMLGRIKNEQIVLSDYGVAVKREIENISAIRKECIIEKFVVMPNHIHLIVQIVGDDGNRPVVPDKTQADCSHSRADCHPPLRKSVSSMVQGLKGAVSRQIGFSLWQRSFHDHIVRDEKSYRKIYEYIENNLMQWELDCHNPANPKYNVN
jgi:REP element-mobilizing transposase RayT